MGEALGKGLLAGLLIVLGYFTLTGFTAVVSGIVALAVHGVAKTVATWVFGISLGLFGIPLLCCWWEGNSDKLSEKLWYMSLPSLMKAVEDSDVGKVETLLKKGKNPNEIKHGDSALTLACNAYPNKELDEIVWLLLDTGADPNIRVPYEDWNEKKAYNTPLKLAITNDRVEAVSSLISHGVIIDSIDRNTKEPLDFMPLQYALLQECNEIAAILLEAGAVTDQYMHKDSEQTTMIMKLFQTSRGFTDPQNSKIRILEELVKRGNDVNARDKWEKTAFHYCATNYDWSHDWWEKRSELAEKLLSFGADINAQDKRGITPLMLSVDSYNPKAILPAVDFLVSHGADTSLRDNEGKTALDLFLYHNGNAEIEREEEDQAAYDKIVELLSMKKKTAENTKKLAEVKSAKIQELTAPSQNVEIAKTDFSAGEHTELDDIEDNW